jgi:hypothetical protein
MSGSLGDEDLVPLPDLPAADDAVEDERVACDELLRSLARRKIGIDPSCGSAKVPTISSVPRALTSSRRVLWAAKWAGAFARTSSASS